MKGMKNPIQIVLVLLTIASLAFGYYKSSEALKANERADMATSKLVAVEAELTRQEAIAREQRKVAEMSAVEARNAVVRAEQALAECQKRRK